MFITHQGIIIRLWPHHPKAAHQKLFTVHYHQLMSTSKPTIHNLLPAPTQTINPTSMPWTPFPVHHLRMNIITPKNRTNITTMIMLQESIVFTIVPETLATMILITQATVPGLVRVFRLVMDGGGRHHIFPSGLITDGEADITTLGATTPGTTLIMDTAGRTGQVTIMDFGTDIMQEVEVIIPAVDITPAAKLFTPDIITGQEMHATAH